MSTGLQGSKRDLNGMLPGALWSTAATGQLFRWFAGLAASLAAKLWRFFTVFEVTEETTERSGMK